MTRHSWVLLSATALALAAGVAFAVILLVARSSETVPASSAPPVPTRPGTDGAQTAEEALEVARDVFTTAPPYVTHEIESIEYVETTTGAARALLDPSRTAIRWDVPADLDAWLIIARGRFQYRSVPGSATPGPVYEYVWLIVPKETSDRKWGELNLAPDITALGEPAGVPLPLPPYPTPVPLDEPE